MRRGETKSFLSDKEPGLRLLVNTEKTRVTYITGLTNIIKSEKEENEGL